MEPNKIPSLVKQILLMHSNLDKNKNNDIKSGYLISKKWIEKWKKYIQYDKLKFNNKSDIGKQIQKNQMDIEPGNINNEDIFQKSLFSKNELIIKNYYFIVERNLWLNLKSWFGIKMKKHEIAINNKLKNNGIVLKINNIQNYYCIDDFDDLTKINNIKKLIDEVKEDIYSLLNNQDKSELITELNLTSSRILKEDINIDYKDSEIICNIKNEFEKIYEEIDLFKKMNLTNNKDIYIISKKWVDNWKEKIKFNLVKSNIKDFINLHNNKIPNIEVINCDDIYLDFNIFLNDGNKENEDNYIFIPEKCFPIDKNLGNKFFTHYQTNLEYSMKYSNKMYNACPINIFFMKAQQILYHCICYFNKKDFKQSFFDIMNSNNITNKIKNEIIKICKPQLPINDKNVFIEENNNCFYIRFKNYEDEIKCKKEVYIFYLFESKMIPDDKEYFVINKNWIDQWKKLTNYDENKLSLKKNKNNLEYLTIINIKDFDKTKLKKINNFDVVEDMNSFLNDGDKSNYKNIILKKNNYITINH